MHRFLIVPALVAVACSSQAAEQTLFHTQELTSPFTSAADALKGISVPDGVTVQLSAAEPEVQQPIAMAWDSRGRLWVAE